MRILKIALKIGLSAGILCSFIFFLLPSFLPVGGFTTPYNRFIVLAGNLLFGLGFLWPRFKILLQALPRVIYLLTAVLCALIIAIDIKTAGFNAFTALGVIYSISITGWLCRWK